MTARDSRGAGGRARPRQGGILPVALLLVSMSSFQLGGPIAKQLFPLVGAPGASTLRLCLSALVLFGLTQPWRSRPTARVAGLLVGYGCALAGLNLFFYLSIERIPFGISVAINFLGPLGVAVLFSRRRADVAWVMLAGLGIALLMPWDGGRALDPIGLGYSVVGAVCWGLYIVLGQKAGADMPGPRATAWGVAVAALAVLPVGIAVAGPALLTPAALPVALLVAVLSSALPHSLEMIALRRLPARTFGVLMSLEPALACLFGWLMLGERLTLRQDAAITFVILASVGATLTASRDAPPAIDA